MEIDPLSLNVGTSRVTGLAGQKEVSSSEGLSKVFTDEWLGFLLNPRWLGTLNNVFEEVNKGKPLVVLTVHGEIDAHTYYDKNKFVLQEYSNWQEELHKLDHIVDKDDYVYLVVTDIDEVRNIVYHRLVVAKKHKLEEIWISRQNNSYPNIDFIKDVSEGDGSILFLVEFGMQFQTAQEDKYVLLDTVAIPKSLQGKKLFYPLWQEFMKFLQPKFSGWPVRGELLHKNSATSFLNSFKDPKPIGNNPKLFSAVIP